MEAVRILETGQHEQGRFPGEQLVALLFMLLTNNQGLSKSRARHHSPNIFSIRLGATDDPRLTRHSVSFAMIH